MFPKIYHLTASMTQPVRCFDGMILVFSLSENTTVKKEGLEYRGEHLYLINESDLYEIHTQSALLFYLPSALFKTLDIDIFHNDFIIQQPDVISADLTLLFKYYQACEQQTHHAQSLVTHLLKEVTRVPHTYAHSIDNTLHHMIDYISNHIRERITLEILSKKFHVSTSYISTLFKHNLNMNFYDYTASLKIAKSLEDISIHDQKVKTVAELWHYPSATNYIINFKKYMGITPKKYKSLPVNDYELRIPNTISDVNALRRLHIDPISAKQKTTILINDTYINEPPFSFFNLIDIGSFSNIDKIMTEPIFFYKNFANYKLASYIYISEPIENIITDHVQTTIIKLIKLFQAKIPIAMQLTDIQSYHYIVKAIEDLHFLESEHAPLIPASDQKLLLLLDPNMLDAREVAHIKRDVYDMHITISLDVTNYYLNRQAIDDDIVALKPDFYTIDFQKVKDHHKQQSNHETFKKIQWTLYQFLEQNNMRHKTIFLNYDAFYTPEILHNTGLLLKESLKSQPYLAGASITFTQSTDQNRHIALFDSIENKTTFYFLGIMLLNFSKYHCYYGDNYVVTQSLHSYNVLLYNTKSYDQDFYITHQEDQILSPTLISTEILNSQNGAVDSMICPRIKDKSRFPNLLKFKLSQYNTPHFSVDEHDFDNGAYVTKIPAKSVAMVTLYNT
ncbi:hypothetical protein TP70_00685 [Staphylococcus microti]|uniref:AraC family transcriptional regulator n=1 Tax=Staphylococcus microti TaxID=569857 RepID=A0A0D6XT92_9STAP|nr:helix-turn-helix transcriptional regulator [Staphylococcus microti]KIX91827.1 hypothetical protein TP70_00685 [Staphylococcus microti]PNZ83534.1 AraC family transcriptional regulator [Staphylococcus microti]SUM58399.1 AraC family transcriptional regulator [Staphylococcus microti]